ncbi:MAG: DUF11 domain-containing protein [Gammaproteobacteria bacterium]|nr:DUF11 domain-containing protein [Gammaproteobacteria bacterium]
MGNLNIRLAVAVCVSIAVRQGVAVAILLLCAVSTHADVTTQLDWDSLTWPAGSTSQTYTIGSGDVSITLNGSTDTPPGDTGGLANGSPFITNDLTGGLSPIQDSLEINVDYPATSLQQIPIIIDFTHPGGVSNVSFNIFDVDLGSWVDVVQVTATTDGVTYFNPTSIASNSANTSDGINTVTGTSGSSSSSNGTATFTFANSGITQIRILYSNQNTAFQWIALHDINFTYSESDLSISKTHTGIFNQGDVETYTLRVSNNAAASDDPGIITVTDTLPAGLTYVNATGTGWTCGAIGQDVTCTNPGPLSAGNSLSDITLEVLVDAAAVPSVTNTATVSGLLPDSNTGDNTDTDLTTVVGNPAITAGNKPLYLYSDTNGDTDPDLSRSPPTTAQTRIRIRKNNEVFETWVLNPQTQADLIIDGDNGTIPVELILNRCNSCGNASRSVQVTLSTSLGVIGTVSRNLSLNGTPTSFTFLVPISGDISLPSGSTISLTVTNVTPGSGGRRIFVYPENGGSNSRVELTSETVINVDDIEFYDAAFPGGSLVTSVLPGSNIFARATVSDPFGSFDISNALISIIDADSSSVVTNAVMTELAGASGAIKTFEYAYLVAATPLGTWNAVVTSNEGTEGIVSDNAAASFLVGGTPDVIFLKTSQVIDDGLGTVAPIAKAIPGAAVLYRLAASNQGDGATDSNLTIVDSIPSNTSLCVANPCAQGLDPIQFLDAPVGTTASGLSYSYASDVEYSKSSGPIYTYGATLTPDGNGYDQGVTRIRISPSGQFNPASGLTPAGFQIIFRVQVQ